MYTIYKGLKPNGEWKIGCDQNYPNRALEQNLTDYFILESYEDIMIASNREIELQKEHNVDVDRCLYYQTKIRAAAASRSAVRNGNHNFQTMSKETRIEIAKRTTPFKNSEFQSTMGKRSKGISRHTSPALAKALNVAYTCEHCGKSGNGRGNYTRWHGDNCKQK